MRAGSIPSQPRQDFLFGFHRKKSDHLTSVRRHLSKRGLNPSCRTNRCASELDVSSQLGTRLIIGTVDYVLALWHAIFYVLPEGRNPLLQFLTCVCRCRRDEIAQGRPSALAPRTISGCIYRPVGSSYFLKSLLTLWNLLLVGGLVFVQSLRAGEHHSLGGMLAADAELFLGDAISFFAAPRSFGSNEWSLAAAASGTVITLMVADQELQSRIGRDTERNLNNDFWDIPTRYGIVQYANLFSFGTYAIGLFTGSDAIRTTGRLLFESLSISGVSVMALRFLFGRSRPYGENNAWDYNWFEWSNEIQSFPSGHTTVAFALSTVLAEQLGGVLPRVGLYGLATLTGFARVYNNQHWVSDAVAGGLLGFVAGLHVVGRERERRNGSADSANLELSVQGGGISIMWWLR